MRIKEYFGKHLADDSRLIIKVLQTELQQDYGEGFIYAKAQVMLLDLCRRMSTHRICSPPSSP